MTEFTSGIVKSVDSKETIVETVGGEIIKIPRFFGEAPAKGTVVTIDDTSSGPKLFLSPPATKITDVKRYMNFYAVEADGNLPSEPIKQAKLETTPDVQQEIGQFGAFNFADTPAGARTLNAGNGNMVFASPTAAGIVTSCESKMIVRDNGTAELVTPHFMGLMGRTVIVSSFQEDLSIEIDITTELSSGGADDLQLIKKKIADLVVGENGVGPVTYEDAFAVEAISGPNGPFIETFGLHLAELLMTFKWSRLKYTGSEKNFHEVFGELGMFDSLYIYCLECINADNVASLEIFLSPGLTFPEPVDVNVPSCEVNVTGTITGLNATFNGDQYTAYAASMTLRNGTTIEYALAKRVYALSHGVMAKAAWSSSDNHAVYAETFHANIDRIAFPDLTISPNTPGFCGTPVSVPTITWGGDFNLNILGNASIVADGNATFYGGSKVIIGGGTKGIQVDNTGSSAITL